MDAIQAMMTRATVGLLIEPAPNDADLKAILEAAVRAPDHGRLKPWRFAIVRGEARVALGELMASTFQRRSAGATDAQVQREKQKPLRSPMIVVVGAKIQQPSNIPAVEQLLAAGAAAQNMLIAAHALGYAGAWKTGDAAYDPDVKAAFGLSPEDAILGFIYLGTAARAQPASAMIDLSDHVHEWAGGTAPLQSKEEGAH